MASYLITGTSRGIGLETVRQLLERPVEEVSKIVAVTRNNSSEALNALVSKSQGRIVNVIISDVTDEDKVQASIDSQSKTPSDPMASMYELVVLINNAGIGDWTPGGVAALKAAKLQEVFNADVISAHLVTSTLLPLLKAGQQRKIINISTPVGSMAYAQRFAFAPAPAYKIAKAAMNMWHTTYALDLKEEGFTVLAVSPGWLRTDMGTQDADLDVDVGVAGVLDWVFKAEPSLNGKFVNIKVPGWENAPGMNQYDGKEIPW
ncbi:Putative short-chain dehydrogenase/reductase SDR, NAD(P)-binding domain superfamily [Septoria linicola]|uniref:Short-chain dehydrogenase/reductase SDR, NAD(P)-binding domain superfamily n=1 Tax=Septoria linicola TaxID=215465 RepID=A0A9Q9ALH7_9PEZI|nr:Putative short-chain dehydrogenase/reductase SDR, NAD(P)-binding domain superfamily [Septoria linicola]